MIVSRKCREPRFRRYFFQRDSHAIELAASGKAISARGQTTEKANKARTKKRNVYTDPDLRGPAGNQVLPEKWKDHEVGPDHDFCVVPFPRRELYQTRQREDGGGGNNKREIGWNSQRKLRLTFPKGRDTQTKQ